MLFHFVQSFGVANPKQTTTSAVCGGKNKKKNTKKKKKELYHQSVQNSGRIFKELIWVSGMYIV